MTKLFRWIHANLLWILRGWRVWAPLAVVVLLAATGSFLPGSPEDHARYIGVVLQLLGIGTVVHGLRDRRRLFQRPSLLGHIRAWFAGRPRLNPKPHLIHAASGHIVASGSTAKISVWHGLPPDGSLEARIEALQANLETLRKEHADTSRELRDEVRVRADQVDLERRTRETAIGDIRSRVDTLGAGGLHIESAGLFWLIIGVVLGTVPGEIASLVRLP